MTKKNIIHSLVIVLTVILCLGYMQKKGFSFFQYSNNLNWESFPKEKHSSEELKDKPKLEEKKEPKKEEKIEKKSEEKPEEKNQPNEKIDEKPEESIPQNNKPRLFRRGKVLFNCVSGSSWNI